MVNLAGVFMESLSFSCANFEKNTTDFVPPTVEVQSMRKCVKCNVLLVVMALCTLFSYPLRPVFNTLLKLAASTSGVHTTTFPCVSYHVFNSVYGNNAEYSEKKVGGNIQAKAVLTSYCDIDVLFALETIDSDVSMGASRVDPVTGEMMIIAAPVTLKYSKDKYGAEKLTAKYFVIGVR
jgi:hypothetical protein